MKPRAHRALFPRDAPKTPPRELQPSYLPSLAPVTVRCVCRGSRRGGGGGGGGGGGAPSSQLSLAVRGQASPEGHVMALEPDRFGHVAVAFVALGMVPDV